MSETKLDGAISTSNAQAIISAGESVRGLMSSVGVFVPCAIYIFWHVSASTCRHKWTVHRTTNVWNKVMDYILGFLHASWTAEGTGWICTGFRIRYGEQEKGFYWQNAGVPHLNHWIFQIVTLTTDPIWSACHLIHVEPAQVWWILHASICRIHGGVCELCSWKLCQRGLGGQGGFANLWKQITQILVYVILLFRVPKAFSKHSIHQLSWILVVVMDWKQTHTHIYIYTYIYIYIYICEKDVYFVDLNLRHMCNIMFSTARNTWQNWTLKNIYIYIYIVLFELPLGQDPPNHPVLQVPWPAGKHWSTGSWDDVSCSLRNI